jgi:hypothetical protein
MAQPITPVAANFPFPVLTPFASDLQPPTHATLQVLQRELNANAMSVHSNNGGGRHGHLTLTVTPERYNDITQAAFPVPIAPPANMPMPNPATSVAISEAVRRHTEQIRVFQRYHDTDKALVRSIIVATPNTYIAALSDVDFGYANVTTLQMLTHLRTPWNHL